MIDPLIEATEELPLLQLQQICKKCLLPRHERVCMDEVNNLKYLTSFESIIVCMFIIFITCIYCSYWRCFSLSTSTILLPSDFNKDYHELCLYCTIVFFMLLLATYIMHNAHMISDILGAFFLKSHSWNLLMPQHCVTDSLSNVYTCKCHSTQRDGACNIRLFT